VLDGRVYGPRGDVAGYRDGGPAEVGADVVAAAFNAASEVVSASVDVMR
jgi:hypothetical protein